MLITLCLSISIAIAIWSSDDISKNATYLISTGRNKLNIYAKGTIEIVFSLYFLFFVDGNYC